MLKRLRPVLPDGCVSDLSFDGLRAGELPSATQKQIADHVSECERCRERQRVLQQAFAEVAAQLPLFVPRTDTGRHQPAARAGARRSWPGYGVTALALAACALFAVRPWAARDHGGGLDVRTKGGPGLSFYVKRGEAVFAWTPGDPVTAGDTLRFVVSPRGYAEIAILSRGEDGETSQYYPEVAHSAAIEAAAASVTLDGAVELDDKIRDERIFAVFCRSRFTTPALQDELRATGQLSAPQGCAVATLELPKRRNP